MGTNLSVEDIPNDIVNEIVPYIDFREYHNLRFVSREKLDSTQDGNLHRKIVKLEPFAMKKILRLYSQYTRMPLSMAEVMEALKSQKCECGHFAWQMFCFSFPPRRICLRVHREGPERTTCFPRLVKEVPNELCERYGLSLSDLSYLPRVTSFAAPRCLDLKTIEDISGRKHGRVFVASATRKLIAEKSDWLDVGPWELTVSQPVPIGYSSRKINIRIFHFKDRDNKESPTDCAILALTCSVCKYENITHSTSTYEFVPHEIHHLRNHVIQYHPTMVPQFDEGWAALPPQIRDNWSTQGKQPCDSYYQLQPYGTTSWNGWADTIRGMLLRTVYTKERDLKSIRHHWKTYFGALKAYSLPDIKPAVDVTQAYQRVDDWDMSVLLESFYLMREWAAVDEFAARWKDEGERMKLWNEIVGFWGYSQVYPFPPVPHRQGPMRQLEER